MLFLPLLLSGVLALGAGAAERKLTPEQCTNLNGLIKLEETKLASFASENEKLYNCALTSDMGDVTEDIRGDFLQIITAENNLNKQKRKFIASLKETYDKNCSEYEEVRAEAGAEHDNAVAKHDEAIAEANAEYKKAVVHADAKHDKAFAKAYDEYEEARAGAEHSKAMAEADAKRDEAMAEADVECGEAIDEANAKRDEAIAEAYAKYEAARAAFESMAASA